MKRRVLTIWLMAMALVVGLGAPSDAATFGSGPYTATRSAAASRVKCGLTTNKLTALMLAVTWAEVTDNNLNLVPSPMALSRSDKSRYFSHPSGSFPRAYWHPGTGMWQWDDAGYLGSNMGYDKFVTRSNASYTAHLISNRYCTYRTVTGKLFQGWFGCLTNGSRCVSNYNAIYKASTDSISLSKPAVAENGGAQSHSCRFPGQTSRFYCVFVDPAKAQGYASYWRDVSPNGTTYISPVTKPFYIYTTISNGVVYEVRVWPKNFSGYTSSVRATRAYGAQSRSAGGLVWLSWSSGSRLCAKATSTATEVCY